MSIEKPFLKWVGGKTQIIEDVLGLFPKDIRNYHEPFVGGGSVLLGLLSSIKCGLIRVSGTVYASDLNPTLIGLYKNIQSNPDEVIAEVKQIAEDFANSRGTHVNRRPTTIEEARSSPESYYYWIRSRFNALPKESNASPLASAMFLFMNKTCFRGVYREGPNGFNVPYGNYKNPCILDEAHIRVISELIQDVVFVHCPYTDAFAKVEAGDFIYLDPPYAPESATSFVSYTADGFSLDDHHSLFRRCHDIREKGARFIMSNTDVPLVRDAFQSPPYTTKVVSCRRSINSKKPESKTNEVLISSF